MGPLPYNYDAVPADVQNGHYNGSNGNQVDLVDQLWGELLQAEGAPQQRTKKRAKGHPSRICSECQEQFWNEKTYGDHMSKAHNIKAFPCGRGNCPAAFSRPDPLKDHRCKKESPPSPATVHSSSSPSTPRRPRKNRVNIHIASQTESPKFQSPTRIAKQSKSDIPRQTEPEMAPTRRNPSRDSSRSSKTSLAEVATPPSPIGSREDRDIYRKRIRDLEEREDRKYAECHEWQRKFHEMEKKYRELERELFSTRERMESADQRRRK